MFLFMGGLFIVSGAIAWLLFKFCQRNIEAAESERQVPAVKRVIEEHRRFQDSAHTDEEINVGHYDPKLETMLENGHFIPARNYAQEKLELAHLSGEDVKEALYREYLERLDKLLLGIDEAAMAQEAASEDTWPR